MLSLIRVLTSNSRLVIGPKDLRTHGPRDPASRNVSTSSEFPHDSASTALSTMTTSKEVACGWHRRLLASAVVVVAAPLFVVAWGQTRPSTAQPTAIEATFVASIGGGPHYRRFKLPRGLAVAPTGEVYVADSGYCRIQVSTANGTFLFKWGTPGNGAGQFQGPAAIAFDAAANVYVADTMNHRSPGLHPRRRVRAHVGIEGRGRWSVQFVRGG